MKPKWNEIIYWREIIEKVEKDSNKTFQFLSPITDAEVEEVESKLEVEYPVQLLSLQTVSNGSTNCSMMKLSAN